MFSENFICQIGKCCQHFLHALILLTNFIFVMENKLVFVMINVWEMCLFLYKMTMQLNNIDFYQAILVCYTTKCLFHHRPQGLWGFPHGILDLDPKTTLPPHSFNPDPSCVLRSSPAVQCVQSVCRVELTETTLNPDRESESSESAFSARVKSPNDSISHLLDRVTTQ